MIFHKVERQNQNLKKDNFILRFLLPVHYKSHARTKNFASCIKLCFPFPVVRSYPILSCTFESPTVPIPHRTRRFLLKLGDASFDPLQCCREIWHIIVDQKWTPCRSMCNFCGFIRSFEARN